METAGWELIPALSLQEINQERAPSVPCAFAKYSKHCEGPAQDPALTIQCTPPGFYLSKLHVSLRPPLPQVPGITPC